MIFLDSGYFIGLMDEKDNHHDEAMEIRDDLHTLKETTVINTTVLVETLNRLSGTRVVVKSLWDDMRLNNTVVCLNNDDYKKSLEINGWYNNAVNYSDCTILKTMMDFGITRIVSFDEAFKNICNYEVISDKGMV